MPNWCANSLKLTPNTDEAKTMLAKIEAILEEAQIGNGIELFNTIHPMPTELIETTKGSLGDEEKEAENQAKIAVNMAKHGYPTWYEFANAEWGTKWDAVYDWHDKRGDSLVITFDTAWSPPMGIYTKLEAMGFDVEATYCEQGMGYAGVYRNGVDDEHQVSFYDQDNENNDDIENMFAFFEKLGFDHNPSHTGG